MKRLFVLFWEFFKISLFVIGGGYAILAVADAVSARRKWTAEGEILDELPVFQMIPGLIATHTAVYVGRKIAGWRGACVGVVAVALPSIVIFTLVSQYYAVLPLDNPWLESCFTGLRSALTGIIGATVVRNWLKAKKDVFYFVLLVLGLVALLWHVPVWAVLLAAMLTGILSEFWKAPLSRHKRFCASYLPLLLFLKYGALCFGGGFVLVPMYLEDFVGPTAAFLQVTAEEFSNLMALTQMTPGPIGVNGATYFGFRLAGVPGAVLASAALLLPGSILVYLALASLDRFKTSRIVRGLLRGARPAALALMFIALWAFATMSVFADGSFHLMATILVALSLILTMKKKMNPVLLIILTALVATAVRAEDEITTDRYPDADAVLADEVTRVAYHPDGTYEETSESWTKVLTEKGRREERVIRVDYSKRYGTAAIESLGVIGTNGVERAIDFAATMKESTDNGSMSANIYDPLDRQIVCTIPGLQVGETVHLKVARKALKARCEGVWADLAVFEWSHPIVKSRWEIRAPKELPLKKIRLRHPLGNVAETHTPMDDGGMLHVFSVTNSAQAFPEPDMPPLYTQVQHVRVSTAQDWPEISRWYWNLCAPHLAKTNAAMVAKARELRTIEKIFKFVSQEVRYMGLTMEDTSPGYAPHDVDITFENRYGVCRDKAGLLVALLRLAGHPAYPVLIHVGAKQDPEVPQPFFNHAVVAVAKPEGGYLLMDPTNENANDLFPAYESDKSYIVCRPEGETLLRSPTPSPEHNALRIASHGTLAKDGSLFLESDVRFGGVNDTIYRAALVRMTPEDRVKFFERVVRRLAAGAELVRCEVEPRDMRATEIPVRVQLAARFPEMMLEGETRRQLNVPYLTKHLGMANFLLAGNTSLEKRKYPLEIESTGCVDEKLTIDLGSTATHACTLPEASDEKGGYVYHRAFAVSNGVLSVARRLAVSALTFTPNDYAELREKIKNVEAAERQRPSFAVDPLADADLRLLSEETEVDVHSDCAWTVTTRARRQVLTYKGKKSSAELKFTYNPCVEAEPRVSAVVSNANGKVARVTPKEMNVMDCGWAASAPRYPASKILVVNLPAVEIGSVISHSVVRAVTNAPVGYYGEFLFDSHEPLDRRRVRVNGWSREVLSPRRLPNEPNQPAASFWRDQVIVASNRFEKIDLAVGPFVPSARLWTTNSVRAIRDWMTKYVKIAGPGLYEVPFAAQKTPPAVVLKDRSASRLDYIRTLASLLQGAGFSASVVFAAPDAGSPDEVRRRIMTEKPKVRAFAIPLCRVRDASGRICFLGTENEYAPLGATAHEKADFFDPATGSFGRVTVPAGDLGDRTGETTVYRVRADGAVDLTVTSETWGCGVGGFRKRYAEMLPEDRSRHYQAILGAVAQAASATSELETDLDSYPARRTFSCYIPDFATVANGQISLELPTLISSIPSFTATVRKTPFAIGAEDSEFEDVTVRFPEGYVEVEHVPESFAFADPRDPQKEWLVCRVTSRVVDGALEVHLRRDVRPRLSANYPADLIDHVKGHARRADSRASRTISVRRTPRTPVK